MQALEALSARLGECEAAASLTKRLHADVQRVEASVGEASSLARALLAAQKRFAKVRSLAFAFEGVSAHRV